MIEKEEAFGACPNAKYFPASKPAYFEVDYVEDHKWSTHLNYNNHQDIYKMVRPSSSHSGNAPLRLHNVIKSQPQQSDHLPLSSPERTSQAAAPTRIQTHYEHLARLAHLDSQFIRSYGLVPLDPSHHRRSTLWNDSIEFSPGVRHDSPFAQISTTAGVGMLRDYDFSHIRHHSELSSRPRDLHSTVGQHRRFQSAPTNFAVPPGLGQSASTLSLAQGIPLISDHHDPAPSATGDFVSEHPQIRGSGLMPRLAQGPPAQKHRSSGTIRNIPLLASRDQHGEAILPDQQLIVQHNSKKGILKVQGHGSNVRPNDFAKVLGDDIPIRQLLPQSGILAIHIVQNRMDGKTSEAYVEFPSFSAALNCLKASEERAERNQDTKLSAHHARVILSCDTEMMKAIFPHALCSWRVGRPVIDQAYLQQNPGPFQGFITKEEMLKAVSLANHPDSIKAHASRHCPERVYEFMMTSLAKIPWDEEPRDTWFSSEWLLELVSTIEKMAIKLAHEIRAQRFLRLDIKLLIQFMHVVRHTPLFARTIWGADRYNDIADRVDSIVKPVAFKTPAQLEEIGKVARAELALAKKASRRRANTGIASTAATSPPGGASNPSRHSRSGTVGSSPKGDWRQVNKGNPQGTQKSKAAMVTTAPGAISNTQRGVADPIKQQGGRFAALSLLEDHNDAESTHSSVPIASNDDSEDEDGGVRFDVTAL